MLHDSAAEKRCITFDLKNIDGEVYDDIETDTPIASCRPGYNLNSYLRSLDAALTVLRSGDTIKSAESGSRET